MISFAIPKIKGRILIKRLAALVPPFLSANTDAGSVAQASTETHDFENISTVPTTTVDLGTVS